MPSTLLIVYDAEDPRCCRLVDRLGRWDRNCHVVTFPYQNGELVRVAPELAGLAFPGWVYTLDLETRQVWGGRKILPEVLRRLPAWSWIAGLARIPPVAGALFWFLKR